MATARLQMANGRGFVAVHHAARNAVESVLEAERDRLALWVPVAFGTGIVSWFALATPRAWTIAAILFAALTVIGIAIGVRHRRGRATVIVGLLSLCGLALIWWRADARAAPVLARPVTTAFSARVLSVEPLPARDQVRLVLAPAVRPDLPPRVRLSLSMDDPASGAVRKGDGIGLRARLMPPPRAGVPRGYDFAVRAWFDRIGAVGTAIGPVRLARSLDGPRSPPLRQRLSDRIRAAMPGSAGAIAATLVTGDRGAIPETDAEAMRYSGLAHLLSISGLHVTAVVGAAMLFAARLLALSPWFALRWSVWSCAAAFGAAAGIGYTLLSGAEVPTVRSAIAALLVLAALVIGREAVTLRLVAAGAMFVLVLWPEALIGPSFQMSFAAVTTLVALHESPWARRWLSARDEGRARRVLRAGAGLIITGLVIEAVLTPIALFHFHQSGVYGALANVVAIPLTTMVIMPLLALAVLLDPIGIAAPLWWSAGVALDGLLRIAHGTAALPGAVRMVPMAPSWTLALAIAGLLWILLWSHAWRWWGLVPAVMGTVAMAMTPAPDLVISADGQHVAARMRDGAVTILRDRAGDFTREMLGEATGVRALTQGFADHRDATCSRDFCRWTLRAPDTTGPDTTGPRPAATATSDPQKGWAILAARSNHPIDRAELTGACAAADIVIAARFLPQECTPRWIKADRNLLATWGGLAVGFSRDGPWIVTSRDPYDRHPWNDPPLVSGNDEVIQPASLGSAHVQPRTAAAHARR